MVVTDILTCLKQGNSLEGVLAFSFIWQVIDKILFVSAK